MSNYCSCNRCSFNHFQNGYMSYHNEHSNHNKYFNENLKRNSKQCLCPHHRSHNNFQKRFPLEECMISEGTGTGPVFRSGSIQGSILAWSNNSQD